MKTIDVIKHAEDRSPFRASSALLKWEPSSNSILIKSSKWYPFVSIFDKVIVHYNVAGLKRSRDHARFETFLSNESKQRILLKLLPNYSAQPVEGKNPSRESLLTSMSSCLTPSVDRDLYWKWAFQYMLIIYCHEVKSSAAGLESKLNSLVTSSAYTQLEQGLGSLFNSVSKGDTLSYRSEITALLGNIDKIRLGLNTANYEIGSAYSDLDGRRYSRPNIQAGRLRADASGNLEVPPHSSHAICIANPEKLIDCWTGLVDVLASIGIPEPKPYGITFCQDNMSALASLHEVAKLDYAEPQKWSENNTKTEYYESTPVSAMEFA